MGSRKVVKADPRKAGGVMPIKNGQRHAQALRKFLPRLAQKDNYLLQPPTGHRRVFFWPVLLGPPSPQSCSNLGDHVKSGHT